MNLKQRSDERKKESYNIEKLSAKSADRRLLPIQHGASLLERAFVAVGNDWIHIA